MTSNENYSNQQNRTFSAMSALRIGARIAAFDRRRSWIDTRRVHDPERFANMEGEGGIGEFRKTIMLPKSGQALGVYRKSVFHRLGGGKAKPHTGSPANMLTEPWQQRAVMVCLQ